MDVFSKFDFIWHAWSQFTETTHKNTFITLMGISGGWAAINLILFECWEQVYSYNPILFFLLSCGKSRSLGWPYFLADMVGNWSIFWAIEFPSCANVPLQNVSAILRNWLQKLFVVHETLHVCVCLFPSFITCVDFFLSS